MSIEFSPIEDVGGLGVQNPTKVGPMFDIDQSPRAIQELTLEIERLKMLNLSLVTKLRIIGESQSQFMPSGMLKSENFTISGKTIQAELTGGDFFHYSKSVNEVGHETLHVAVVDVCDKGPRAAMLANLIQGALLASLPGPGGKTNTTKGPEDVVTGLNKTLFDVLGDTDFATMLYGELDTKTGLFNYVRAGYQHILMVGQDGRPIDVPRITGIAIGLMDNINLETGTIYIPEGAAAVIVSDGITEQPDHNFDMFGDAKLEYAVAEAVYQDADKIVDHVIQRHEEHRVYTHQHDDITIAVIKNSANF